jgi:hypothetical protein
MTFPQQIARPFTRAEGEALEPEQSGCYGLFRGEVWVYIGKGDIRQRLLDHLNGDNPCITRQAPTHWVSVVTPFADEREKSLILECKPVCNKRVG